MNEQTCPARTIGTCRKTLYACRPISHIPGLTINKRPRLIHHTDSISATTIPYPLLLKHPRIPRIRLLRQHLSPLHLLRFLPLITRFPYDRVYNCDENECSYEACHNTNLVVCAGPGVKMTRGLCVAGHCGGPEGVIRMAFRLFSRVGDVLVGSIEGRNPRTRGECSL